MKTVSAFVLLLASSAVPMFAGSPVWDTSGNSLLTGNYYFREVRYVSDTVGNTSQAMSLYGTITFNAGQYTLTGLGGVDSSNGVPTINTVTTYSLSSTGYGFLSDPLTPGGSVSILVSGGVLIGSNTQAISASNSIFIAAPITGLSTSSFSGAYTVSAFLPSGSPATALDATYQLNADGAGHLSNFTISGYTGGGQSLSQAASGITYKFSNSAAVISYPNSNTAYFYAGQEFAYFSPDTNFIFGGSPTGYDMFIGVKNAAPGASTPLNGLYYEAGMEQYGAIDSFYGSLNTSGDGNFIGHEQVFLAGQTPSVGTTYYSVYPTTLTGSYTISSGSVQYTIGKNGFRIGYGTGGGYLLMSVAMPYTPPAPSTAVYIDPTGIVNTASSAPYTAGISPGGFLTFYNGFNLAPSTLAATDVPYPTSLNGVQVLIDGIQAPIYYVSSTQVSVIVPYDVSTFPVASIQIKNNGVLSNTVTMNVHQTTPGVFTSDPVGGIGVAALVDFPAAGGYYIVDNSHPAHPGDNVALYLTGLGLPFPSSIAAGAAGPASGDSLVQTISVSVGGTDVGTPAYEGLAPSLAGLYQINFTIPAAVTAGDNVLSIDALDSESTESYIPITLTGSAVESASPVPAARHQGRPRMGIELHR